MVVAYLEPYVPCGHGELLAVSVEEDVTLLGSGGSVGESALGTNHGNHALYHMHAGLVSRLGHDDITAPDTTQAYTQAFVHQDVGSVVQSGQHGVASRLFKAR